MLVFNEWYGNGLIIFFLIINVLIHYSWKNNSNLSKTCRTVSPIFCLIVFKCLKEFIFQLELTSRQVEIEIPEVLLYTVKQISESYNLGLEESSTGILGIDQLLIYCTCTIIHALERF